MYNLKMLEKVSKNYFFKKSYAQNLTCQINKTQKTVKKITQKKLKKLR